MKRAFGIIIDVLTFLVFLVLVLIIISRVKMMISGKEYFDVFGYSIFNVATGSMEPAISQNDIIIVKAQKEYELNDIVTFKSDNAYVTHRVISKSGNKIVTKGDANNAKDVSIKQEEIIGKVVNVIRQGGIWQQIFTSPTIIIMIFVTLMLFDFAFSYRGSETKVTESKESNISLINKIKDKTKELKVKKEEKIKQEKQREEEKKKERKEKQVEKKKKLEEEKMKKLEEEKKKQKQKKDKKNSSKEKLSDKEIVDLYKKSEMAKESSLIEEEEDDDPFGYTVRLDLSELQKRINEKMNEDKDE